MSPIPESSSVNLPPRRGAVRDAIKAGATTREELTAHLRKGTLTREQLEKELADRGRTRFVDKELAHPDEKPKRARKVRDDAQGGDTLKVAAAEYDLLTSVALLAQVFLPMLEKCGAPVQRPTEWSMLQGRLKLLENIGFNVSLTAAETDAVIGLLNAQRLLADDDA